MRPIPITAICAMSQARRKALWNDEEIASPRILPVALSDLTAAQQFALVSWSRNALCRAVAERLRASTLRHTPEDRKTLRLHGLATQADGPFHRLTEEGEQYAISAAKIIARELGLHLPIGRRKTLQHTAFICACGYAAIASNHEYDANAHAERKFAKHLVDVQAGRWKAM